MRKDTIGRRIGEWFLDSAATLVSSQLARRKLRKKNYLSFRSVYGDFRFGEPWRELTRRVPGSESGIIFGQVVRMVSELNAAAPLLLAGESASAKAVYAEIAGIPVEGVTTAGLHDDADIRWNFENPPPEFGPFRCIVSHAIIEHLLNPYGHLADLRGLLAPGGDLIVYTVTPGFQYHRHPIDCLRFFPDWFEEIAERHGLEVRDRFMGDDHIVYRFADPT